MDENLEKIDEKTGMRLVKSFDFLICRDDIIDFKKYLYKESSQSTYRGYTTSLNNYIRKYVVGDDKIRLSHKNFLEFFANNKSSSNMSMMRKLMIYLSFIKRYYDASVVDMKAYPMRKPRRKVTQPVSSAELECMMAHKKFWQYRDAYRFLHSGGFRISELCKLTRESIPFNLYNEVSHKYNSGEMTDKEVKETLFPMLIMESKGGKTGITYINFDSVHRLVTYCEKNEVKNNKDLVFFGLLSRFTPRIIEESDLFVHNNKNQRKSFDKKAIYYYIRNIEPCLLAYMHTAAKKYLPNRVVKPRLHDLRAGHATEALNNGVSLVAVQKQLRHSLITTTQRYAKLSNVKHHEEFKKML